MEAERRPSDDDGGGVGPASAAAGDDGDADTTIHGFNASNVTVIENLPPEKKAGGCEQGSDSGVEVAENADLQRANSQEFDRSNGARSCDSSIISYCSNYEEAYNILVRKNSTLLEDYTLRTGDVTSENGSESSSISGSQLRVRRPHVSSASKKKVSLPESKSKTASAKDRSRSKPPTTPSRSSTSSARLKSLDRVQGKTPVSSTKPGNRLSKTPNSLDVTKKENKRTTTGRSLSGSAPAAKTNVQQVTPTDDGRWPSIHSRPAPLMSRSLKGSLDQKFSKMDNKTIEKYATLPRRRKEKSSDNVKDVKKPSSRENSLHRLGTYKKSSKESTPSKLSATHFLPKPKQKTKIYHETCIQTALTMSDMEKALSGIIITPRDPADAEKFSKHVQVDMRRKDVEKLQEDLRRLTEKHDILLAEHKSQTDKLKETEDRLKEETLEKDGLRLELNNNSERVLSILGKGNVNPGGESSSDSLMVLESSFQNVSQVVIRQEEEIARLNGFARALQRDLEKSVAAQKNLLQQQQDLEAEGIELQEFMQAEKTTLTDALKETEVEINRQQSLLAQKERELTEQQRLNGSLRSRLASLETRSRELLVQQGSAVSGAAVALSALVDRLRGLVDELVIAYAISEQELEDAVFHNEAYHNSASSPESTPERTSAIVPRDKDPSPKSLKPGGSSFVSAVINAIKNAAAQTPFSGGGRETSRDDLAADRSGSSEMLDSETEPCLMMEHVLEDVVVPDGHSHNMISSGHGSMLTSRLTHSESLKDLPQSFYARQTSEPSSFGYTGSMNASDMICINELFPSVSLVDQVIEVDNLITRLLKVIRIIHVEHEDYVNELQDHRDGLEEQIDQQKETNKVVVKQLKDWEVLGARLKTEVKELMARLSRKNSEMDGYKCELNKQREEVEKLNQDVCELSTALAKAELETRMKEEEASEEIKRWEKTGEIPTPEILGRLIVTQSEVPVLKETLAEKEKRLSELTQEFLTSRQVLSENFKDAVNEAKKQYDAIDNALEVLHSIQTVVQQCPPLTKLQRQLEEISFQSASAMPLAAPPDCNANAALLQAVANLEVAPTINTTA